MFTRNVVFVLLSMAGMHRTVFGTVPGGLGSTIDMKVKLFVTFMNLRGTRVIVNNTALIRLFSLSKCGRLGNIDTAVGSVKVAIVLTLIKVLVAKVLMVGGIGKGVL